MIMTAASLAFDIIKRGKPQHCKFPPRSSQAQQVAAFTGHQADQELFISQSQRDLLLKLQVDELIKHEQNGERFAAFVKSIYSEKTGKDYYLLVFSGKPPAPVVAKPVQSSEKANQFAAKLIIGAIEKNRHQRDAYAKVGEQDTYFVTWLSPLQADALVSQLPEGSTKQDGSFITQAAGQFCYWGKKRTQTGAILLCWMGEAGSEPTPAPQADEPVHANADPDIPF